MTPVYHLFGSSGFRVRAARPGEGFAPPRLPERPFRAQRGGSLPVFPPPWSLDHGASVSTGFPPALSLGGDPAPSAKSALTPPPACGDSHKSLKDNLFICTSAC